ncbi:MAG: aminotransferase class I/II-fold pyridoxal phosphate-dependent enzyme, partial [Clostridiales bacterium]|nr:aminotransferase class I/II-fold pyridoxal phosphate-dependent enzyme [Clostridiales bacterium]
CKEKNILLIVDESFVDFADKEKKYTLLTNDILKSNPHLVVIKSISKSYGIPGLRLGVLATSNTRIYAKVKQELSIWNINSMAEYFMQIFPLFEKEYQISCERIAENRIDLIKQLKEISYIENVYPSQANYILCRLDEKMVVGDLVGYLLEAHQIFIKDLSGKRGFTSNQFIRLAVRNKEENVRLIKGLHEYSI